MEKLNVTKKSVTSNINKFKFNIAAETLYHFMWQEIADQFIEYVKISENKQQALNILAHVFLNGIKLLHPFMPFVTEEIWKNISKSEEMLIISKWPK